MSFPGSGYGQPPGNIPSQGYGIQQPVGPQVFTYIGDGSAAFSGSADIVFTVGFEIPVGLGGSPPLPKFKPEELVRVFKYDSKGKIKLRVSSKVKFVQAEPIVHVVVSNVEFKFNVESEYVFIVRENITFVAESNVNKKIYSTTEYGMTYDAEFVKNMDEEDILLLL